MEQQNRYAAYFQSLTFCNDFEHYCFQQFPRLFKITNDCFFVNDNFMNWGNIPFVRPYVFDYLCVKYHHYAFCKNVEKKFNVKKQWWETRFGDNYNNTGKNFDYGWYVDENGSIKDNNHKIYQYEGRHPKVMETHRLWAGKKEVADIAEKK